MTAEIALHLSETSTLGYTPKNNNSPSKKSLFLKKIIIIQQKIITEKKFNPTKCLIGEII